MDKLLAPITSSIAEVTKARQAVMRNRSRQIRSADDIDHLRSVAYAWFKTHRPVLAEQLPDDDLASVDQHYKVILQATQRHATRGTYCDALRDAKSSLDELQSLIVSGAPSRRNSIDAAPAEAAPNFAPLAADPRMQAILDRRWTEVQHCITAQAFLAATVMMGGLMESLLLARINSSLGKAAIFKAKNAPRDKQGKTLPLNDWKLVAMVSVAHELGWISKSAMDIGNVLREFRNYIHPHKEHTDNVQIGDDDARIFWEVTRSISRQILKSVGQSP